MPATLELELLDVDLGHGVRAVFTGRTLPATATDAKATVGDPGNMSARRPHEATTLARARSAVAHHVGFEPADLHTMRQVHGSGVGEVQATTPAGAQFRDVDALITSVARRPLAVMTADCVPLLMAAGDVIAAVHVGRRGLMAGMVDVILERFDASTGARTPFGVRRAAIGPAIAGCCYEVPSVMADEVAAAHPAARATTTWGTTSLDLPAAVRARLEGAGFDVSDLNECTACQPERWFSHRADPGAGRAAGIVMRTGAR